MGWNYLSIPKLQRCNRWSLGMDKLFHPTLYQVYDYLSMLWLKLNHVSKSGHRLPCVSSTPSASRPDYFILPCGEHTVLEIGATVHIIRGWDVIIIHVPISSTVNISAIEVRIWMSKCVLKFSVDMINYPWHRLNVGWANFSQSNKPCDVVENSGNKDPRR